MIVALEGLLGSGKSTTAKRIGARDGNQYFHELSDRHPFLDAFYSDVEKYTFETELVFVLLHYHQFRDLPKSEKGIVITDYSPVKDVVFADMNLEGADLKLFSDLYERTSGSLRLPDLTIYLDVGVPLALDRISSRGREYEKGFDPAYLESLEAAYANRFDELGEEVAKIEISPSMDELAVEEAVAEVIGRHVGA